MVTIDYSFISSVRIKDESIHWLNFFSLESLIESLKYEGFLNEQQIVKFFQIMLKGEDYNVNDETFLQLNKLEYIREEIRDALGDRAIKDITRKSLRDFIRQNKLPKIIEQ